MRSTFGSASVRLYRLDEGDPLAETLFNGPLADAQASLQVATGNEVAHYLDLAGE